MRDRRLSRSAPPGLALLSSNDAMAIEIPVVVENPLDGPGRFVVLMRDWLPQADDPLPHNGA